MVSQSLESTEPHFLFDALHYTSTIAIIHYKWNYNGGVFRFHRWNHVSKKKKLVEVIAFSKMTTAHYYDTILLLTLILNEVFVDGKNIHTVHRKRILSTVKYGVQILDRSKERIHIFFHVRIFGMCSIQENMRKTIKGRMENVFDSVWYFTYKLYFKSIEKQSFFRNQYSIKIYLCNFSINVSSLKLSCFWVNDKELQAYYLQENYQTISRFNDVKSNIIYFYKRNM